MEQSMEDQMQSVVDLLDKRVMGETTNDQVELAVQRMLARSIDPSASGESTSALPNAAGPIENSTGTTGGITASIPKVAGPIENSAGTAGRITASIPKATASVAPIQTGARQSRKRPLDPIILEDTENYDDSEDDESTKQKNAEETKPSPEQRKARVGPRKKPLVDEETIDLSLYEDIPLGKQGAQMMVTFGDGRKPNPLAVEAALHGTRLCLQTAIQDARHVRRRQRKVYRLAKDSLTSKLVEPKDKSEVSNEMLFRATQGYDDLAYDPKCGFTSEDFRQLFPEELNAYSRWTEMHDAAAEKKATAEAADVEAGDEKVSTLGEPSTTLEDSVVAGHLQERAAQFDLRTNKMHDEWYLKYSVLRQGSFLPRRRTKGGTNDASWEAARKHRTLGDRGAGVWSHMSAASVRFLHWIGFDPDSALVPPNDDATNVLAFLGYNFYGKIVEKAIFLKNAKKHNRSGKGNERSNNLVELGCYEQLEQADIRRAMEDPDVKPVPLYSGSATKRLGPQLYFGPGFEGRLELEMEEMMWSSTKQNLTSDERKIREDEDLLFGKLAEAPTQDGIAALLAAREQSEKDKDE